MYAPVGATARHIEELKNLGLRPSFTVLEAKTCSKAEALLSEMFWIEVFRSRGAQLRNSVIYVDDAKFALTPTGLSVTHASRAKKSPVLAGSEKNGDVMKPLPPKHGAPWAPEETEQLRTLFAGGARIPDIAIAMQRSIGGIRSRLVLLGLMEGET
jgi:hypothetical protein